MGWWSKIECSVPPTITYYVEGEQKTSSNEDVEKNGQSLHRKGEVQEHHHVHPDIERRVVRKLDFRVVSLVTALCPSFLIRLTVERRV